MRKHAPLRAVRRAALTLACLGFCWGCGDSSSATPIAERGQAIIGGDVDDGDPAVVALSIHAASGEDGLCSGVVVAPRVVLTAAHCVAPEAVGRGASFSVFLGSDLAVAGPPENRVAVERVAFDPEFSLGPIAKGHDVGVAITAAPMDVTPLDFDPPPALAGVNEVRMIGFGLASASDPSSAGRKRQGVLPLAGSDETFLYLGDGSVPCDGDSGGPVLVPESDGAERIAGVVSFTDGGCGPGAHVSALSGYLPFLNEQIAAADDSPPADSSGCQLEPARRLGVPAFFIVPLAFWLLRRRRGHRPRSRRATLAGWCVVTESASRSLMLRSGSGAIVNQRRGV